MTTLLNEIIRAVDEDIRPALPLMSSEKKRVEMRVTLSALEKMIKHIRLELLKESKQLKVERKEKADAKKRPVVKEVEEEVEEVVVEEVVETVPTKPDKKEKAKAARKEKADAKKKTKNELNNKSKTNNNNTNIVNQQEEEENARTLQE